MRLYTISCPLDFNLNTKNRMYTTSVMFSLLNFIIFLSICIKKKQFLGKNILQLKLYVILPVPQNNDHTLFDNKQKERESFIKKKLLIFCLEIQAINSNFKKKTKINFCFYVHFNICLN